MEGRPKRGGFNRGRDGVFVLLLDLQRGELREEGKGCGVRDGIHVHYSAKVIIKWAHVAGLKHLAADTGI